MELPNILFEDESLIAFDKPGSLLMVPDRSDKKRASLTALVRAVYGDQVANVHRLEVDTSGVVLFAKTKSALDILTGQFQSKTVRQRYLALCSVLPAERALKGGSAVRDSAGGLPAEFEVDLALGEDENQPGRMQIFKRRGGKPSVTRFRTIEAFRGFAWVECVPLTGRTHQVRVHLAATAAPVLNDVLYGDPAIELRLSSLKRGYKGRDDEKPLIERLALHAAGLTFTHPLTKESVSIDCEAPKEMEVALKYLRKFATGRRERH